MTAETPLAIDLFCGLGGWTEGLLAEGYRVVGFDNERHVYGEERYPAQLVIQDVLTIHGKQFKDAALIVASPPCQAYSYRAMPWKRAKALPPPDNSLFEACFRIQREAIEAAGHFIPLVVENVCGAQKWVGRARWHFGSFYLWGDVPAIMPIAARVAKVGGIDFNDFKNGKGKSPAFNGTAEQRLRAEGTKIHTRASHQKGGWFYDNADRNALRRGHSQSSVRKRASALIAKIPLVLSRHIAASWYPISDGAHPCAASACGSRSSAPLSDGHAQRSDALSYPSSFGVEALAPPAPQYAKEQDIQPRSPSTATMPRAGSTASATGDR